MAKPKKPKRLMDHVEPDADDHGSMMDQIRNSDNDADDKKVMAKFIKLKRKK